MIKVQTGQDRSLHQAHKGLNRLSKVTTYHWVDQQIRLASAFRALKCPPPRFLRRGKTRLFHPNLKDKHNPPQSPYHERHQKQPYQKALQPLPFCQVHQAL